VYRINKQFHFSASHVLDGLPADHQCGRLHGHNYVVEVVLEGEVLNAVGFVRDYGELSPIKRFIDEVLDHRHLNDVFPGIQTSAENMARILYERWKSEIPELAGVRISETPKTWAEFWP
jgi:6-pyruvoyltetrahydropterin/6-carboxytetrahydropterin synthase